MQAYTLLHVAISLIAIAAGLVIVFGMLTARPLGPWHDIFLTTTIATSLTGFGFPFEKLLPSHVLGALSLVVLAVACYARYGRKLAGHWNVVYIVTAMVAFYFNFFVLVVQSFLKVPALHELAPTQAESPFAVTQLVVLVAFAALTVLAVRKRSAPT